MNMKRTNSVISSLYHPMSSSKLKTAMCMFIGGVVLICLGSGLIITTLYIKRPSSAHSHVDETSVLISGPTCLALGLVVLVISGTDLFRYRRARNAVQSELNRMIGSMSKTSTSCERCSNDRTPVNGANISIVINKTVWST